MLLAAGLPLPQKDARAGRPQAWGCPGRLAFRMGEAETLCGPTAVGEGWAGKVVMSLEGRVENLCLS